MPNREGSIFFDNGGYQRGTEWSYNSVNIYDKNERVIAVYKKQENGEYLFSITCRLTVIEETYLYKSNGNFVSEVVLKNPKYKDNYWYNNDLQQYSTFRIIKMFPTFKRWS